MSLIADKQFPFMAEHTLVNSPAHYVEGRSIEPIEVIEAYGLCHHLACVVKYISRAGRKYSRIRDLHKAQWYLERELERHHQQLPLCRGYLSSLPPLSLQDIQEDWKLSHSLAQALRFVLESQLPSAGHVYELAQSELTAHEFMDFLVYDLPLAKAMRYLRLAMAEEEVQS